MNNHCVTSESLVSADHSYLENWQDHRKKLVALMVQHATGLLISTDSLTSPIICSDGVSDLKGA